MRRKSAVAANRRSISSSEQIEMTNFLEGQMGGKEKRKAEGCGGGTKPTIPCELRPSGIMGHPKICEARQQKRPRLVGAACSCGLFRLNYLAPAAGFVTSLCHRLSI